MPSTHIIQTQIMYRTNFLEPNRTSGVIRRNPKCALTHKPRQKTMAETFTLLSLGPFTRQNPREKTPRKALPECSLLHPSYLTIPPLFSFITPAIHTTGHQIRYTITTTVTTCTDGIPEVITSLYHLCTKTRVFMNNLL